MTRAGAAKAFTRKIDAQQWLDNEITAKLATGTYVAREAGRVTVGGGVRVVVGVQGHIAPKTAATRRSAWDSRVEPQWGEWPWST